MHIWYISWTWCFGSIRPCSWNNIAKLQLLSGQLAICEIISGTCFCSIPYWSSQKSCYLHYCISIYISYFDIELSDIVDVTYGSEYPSNSKCIESWSICLPKFQTEASRLWYSSPVTAVTCQSCTTESSNFAVCCSQSYWFIAVRVPVFVDFCKSIGMSWGEQSWL